MNSISAGAQLFARGRAGNFKRLGNTRDSVSRTGDIVEMPPAAFMAPITFALSLGLAVLLSPTSDGGAVSVILYDGDDRYRSYASNAEEFKSLMEAIQEHCEVKLTTTPTSRLNGAPRPTSSK